MPATALANLRVLLALALFLGVAVVVSAVALCSTVAAAFAIIAADIAVGGGRQRLERVAKRIETWELCALLVLLVAQCAWGRQSSW